MQESIAAILALCIVVICQAFFHWKERVEMLRMRDDMESEARQLLAAKNLPEYVASKSIEGPAKSYWMSEEEEYLLEQMKKKGVH